MTISLTRRGAILGMGGGLAVGLGGLSRPASAVVDAVPPRAHEPFSFLFVTDAHVQPELNAAAGTAQCFALARTLPADFAIQGGDHVFDALGVPRARADSLMALYRQVEHDLDRPVHHAIGNHDLFGIYPKSGAEPTDPEYGRKFFQDAFGPTYYSFDHKGVHFVMLDSIGVTAARAYEGRIDPAQIEWLKRDLDALPPGAPIVVVSHIPIVTAFAAYKQLPNDAVLRMTSVQNSYEVLPVLYGRNVLGVLQGHTHVNERVDWHGIPFITGGAVSGNWWHGTHLGTPEGFTVVTVADNRLSTEYRTYGFRSVDPHPT